ncbi:DEAD/DEAH box helicase family protein [Marivita sp. S0852]|uniref:DEAD/DEAH box helicase family protein n=1 Tax=Marivita sp. S0852 TaxID=3373893 RepID=UPI0039824679
MSMDFSKLGSTKKTAAPRDPIKIFEALPSLKDTPNDLWRGQAQALSEWHAARDNHDVLISLNTGAGKTIAGLLVAQSLVNEGIPNVVYVCSTIDLVNQTVREAERIGIACTTRTAGNFSNDLFESEKAFCVTTYHALFNGFSAIRRKHFPGAIIFDDAHVAEGILRDSFTMRVTLRGEEELFNEIKSLFEPAFREIGKLGQFRDACGLERHNTAFVPPRYLQERAERLREILLRNGVQGKRCAGHTGLG